MTKLLFISPHLDDVVLSCGAYIASVAGTTAAVTIASVFTSSGEQDDAVVNALYEVRRNDDIRAAALLGATAIHLGFADAPLRNSHYHNFNTLLFHHQLPEQELPVAERIAARLQSLVQTLQPDVVYFPLGVGGHIDHQVVYASSKMITHATIRWYEDLPYAWLPGWSMVRMTQLQGVPDTATAYGSFEAPAVTASTLRFITSYISSEEDKARSYAMWQHEWGLLRQPYQHVLQWQLPDGMYARQAHSMPLHSVLAKADAISCYDTEWPALFGEEKQDIEKTLLAAIHDNQYQELFWCKTE
ncbi:N-acetylglucosaminyl deacetylase, LmbE family [Filimonas lacunae]|uniref:N-acetylglucosaminyl deacetylase, LmbE family n=1 Tax=Filimonas lacunae TaxID=477680 RepID=A0A173MMR2_9BACT|nr:PIG-L family deacetylase [Filimonas lacunae]BAV08668.1 hypothetical protein FLA_4715 [Filimonas lacunae]SIS59647.1 N-acetylglucosaminyl deacetylase, LmbE family [Filimonas lacunae]